MFNWREGLPFFLILLSMLVVVVILITGRFSGGVPRGRVAQIERGLIVQEGRVSGVRSEGGLVVNPVLNIYQPSKSVFAK